MEPIANPRDLQRTNSGRMLERLSNTDLRHPSNVKLVEQLRKLLEDVQEFHGEGKRSMKPPPYSLPTTCLHNCRAIVLCEWTSMHQ